MIFGVLADIFIVIFDLPKVYEKRDSTVDWEAVPDHELQRQTAETGRLRTRRGGERGSCTFPENTKLFCCKNAKSSIRGILIILRIAKGRYSITAALWSWQGRKFRNSRPRDSCGMSRRAPAAAYRRCFPAVATCRLSALSALRVPENQELPVISFGHDEIQHPVFMLRNMICYLGHIKNGRLWPEDLLPRSDCQFGTRSNGQR